MASVQNPRETANRVYQVYLTILLFLGLAGHATSILVFTRFPSLANANTRRIFVSLSAADALVLLTAVLRYWILLMFSYDLRLSNQIVCVLHSFAVYLFGDLALWLLVALSVIRLMAVLWPTFRKPHTSSSFVLILIICLTVVSTVKNSPLLIYVRRVNDTLVSGQLQCDFRDAESARAFAIADFLLYSALPIFLLVGANILLAIMLCRARIRRMGQFGNNAAAATASDETESQSRSGTRMVLVLSAFYLLSNLPTIGFSAFSTISGTSNVGLDSATAEIVSQYLVIFHFIANGTSFLFYCTFNSNFRRCLRQLVTCRTRSAGSIQPMGTK